MTNAVTERRSTLRSAGALGRVLLLLVGGLMACGDVEDQPVTTIGGGGDVTGVLFLDVNGSGRLEGDVDEPVEGASLRLVQPAGGVVGETESDTVGEFSFQPQAGQLQLEVDPSVLGDTLEAFGFAFDPFTLGVDEAVDLVPGLTYPHLSIGEARRSERERPVFTTGIALNATGTGLEALHLALADTALRLVTLDRNASAQPGDSLRVFGRTTLDGGRPALRQVRTFLLARTDPVEPIDLSTAEAADALNGSADAKLAVIENARVTALDSLNEEGLLVEVDDGTGVLEMLVVEELNFFALEFEPDSVMVDRGVGLLVPRAVEGGGTRWRLVPRFRNDLQLVPAQGGAVRSEQPRSGFR